MKPMENTYCSISPKSRMRGLRMMVIALERLREKGTVEVTKEVAREGVKK
jgi:hypothetical protein